MKRTWTKKIRPLRDLGHCLGIELSDGSIALVDYCDRAIVEGWNWSAKPDRCGNVYAHRGSGMLHAAILGRRADHRDGNTLDNRRSNLRPASSAENARNRRLASNNKTGFKGVSLRRDRGTYLASIRFNGRLKKLGTFADKVSAARAYDAAALVAFGDFAFLNFTVAAQ